MSVFGRAFTHIFSEMGVLEVGGVGGREREMTAFRTWM